MAVMLGHSGVGKSSLVNTLSPPSGQATAAVRERDGKGKHTTTSRQLIDVGRHGFIIDTPGVRELGVQSPEAVRQTFDDVAALADECRFSDCEHGGEPGCAVRMAVDAGSITRGRYVGYMKLIREADFAASKGTPNVRNKAAEWNRLSRAYRKARGW
jgi:ribosome biogenesis GTPase